MTQETDFLFTGFTVVCSGLSPFLCESILMGGVDTLVEGWQAAWDAARGVPEHEVPGLVLVWISPVSGMGTSLVLQTCVLTSLPSCRYLATVATGVGGGGDRITLGLDEKIDRYSPFGEDLGRLKRKNIVRNYLG
eukprot:TRINITY_DN11655_c0_g1_i1.p1 TRINITY_DN11655_c0_g1~~TRINITY_DN11655_c0_g1_i1.p1  ORF type:complete len:135 (-),score=19.54 TRINITY_DN11655_c0_g1_i1:361-765(-)